MGAGGVAGEAVSWGRTGGVTAGGAEERRPRPALAATTAIYGRMTAPAMSTHRGHPGTMMAAITQAVRMPMEMRYRRVRGA